MTPNQYITGMGPVLISLLDCDLAIERSFNTIADTARDGGRIFIIGNGGSATTASHMACDLDKSTIVEGAPQVQAISLSDNIATIMAWANDFAYEEVFTEQLRAYNRASPNGLKGDVLLALSASGNSENVIRAVRCMNDLGGKTIAWTGMGGGLVASLVDTVIIVQSDAYGPVEDCHFVLMHALTAWLKTEALPNIQSKVEANA